MRLQSESGKGKLTTFLWLLLIFLVGYAIWKVAPVYYANTVFKDKMRELARRHPSLHPDAVVHAELMKEARDRGLYPEYLRSCQITSAEGKRRIICDYEREVQVIPGIKHRFHFPNDVEERYF